MAKIPTQLQQAAAQVHESGKAKMVKVKELLSWFEAQRRGVLVVREIRSALRKAKLVTVPDFEVASPCACNYHPTTEGLYVAA